MTDLFTRKEAIQLANAVIGNTCQSTILTTISGCGQKSIPQPAQRISGYELIECLGGVELMLVVGGESVLYDTCYNFKKVN